MSTPAPIREMADSIAKRRARTHAKPAAAPATHRCRWPGCETHVSPRFWGCATHWGRLPLEMRERIYELYHPRQATGGRPTCAYVALVHEIDAWARLNCDTVDIERAYAATLPASAHGEPVEP